MLRLPAAASLWLLLWSGALPAQTMTEARQRFQDGNFAEAFGAYEKLLGAPEPLSEADAVTAVQDGVQCLSQLGESPKLDAFLEMAARRFPEAPGVLVSVARAYHEALHRAELLDGTYLRTWGPYDASARDRVRALQLLVQAMAPMASRPAEEQAALWTLTADVLLPDSSQAWRLQALTDLASLPEHDAEASHDIRRAPVDATGAPVFHALPESWAAARTDGERWHHALRMLASLGPSHAAAATLRRADFLRDQFDVHTLTGWGGTGEDEQTELLARKFRALGDHETIARLATGPRAFALPDDQNFILLYREVTRSPDRAAALRAWDVLTDIHLLRDQRPRAAEDLRAAIALAGESPETSGRQETLLQLTGNFGRFTGSRQAAPGAPVRVGFVSRNATSVEMRVRKVDFQRLLEDVKAYLRSNPEELNWQRLNVENLGHRLLQEDQQAYLGAEVARWSVPLDVRPEHMDLHSEIPTPLDQPGAYWLEAHVRDGNRSGVIVWIADTALVRKPLDAGNFHCFVADARTGTPVGDARLEGFGYERKPRRLQREKLRTEVETFTVQANPTGEAILALTDRKEWLITARNGAGRFAYLGFSGLWSRGFQDLRPDEVRLFPFTDRPLYRPGDTVRFKVWIGRSAYDKEAAESFRGQTVMLSVHTPNGETAHEAKLAADDSGGVHGEFVLDGAAALGPWHFEAALGEIITSGSFRVEEYKKPEFEVVVEAPQAPVRLGDTFSARVHADYYFGAPVTAGQAKVKILRHPHADFRFPIGPWDWLYGNGYAHRAPEHRWYPGWEEWGCPSPRWPWMPWRTPEPELIREETLPLGPDGTLAISVDTASAKELHGDEDHRYEIEVMVTDASRRQVTGSGSVIAARAPFDVFVALDRGHYQTGDTIQVTSRAQSPDAHPVDGRAVTRLLRVTYDAAGNAAEEEVASTEGPLRDGSITAAFPATAPGQFRVECSVFAADTVARGGRLVLVRSDKVSPGDLRFNALELIPDRETYRPGETVRLLVNTARQDATVVLFSRPVNGVYAAPTLLRVPGKTLLHEVPVQEADAPNFFLEAYTVSEGDVHQATAEIGVPPETRTLRLAVTPDAPEHRPRDPVVLDLASTLPDGTPFPGQLVVTVYDRALEAIAGGSNVPSLVAAFWDWKRHHHPDGENNLGRFFPGLPLEPKDDMRDFGLGLAGSEAVGDPFGAMPEKRGARMMAEAIPEAAVLAMPAPAMAQAKDGDAFAGGAAAPAAPAAVPMIRTDFADSVFWTAALPTDAQGKAKVTFPLPDNLTSWKVRAWILGSGTRVGEAEAEFATTKKLLLRPQAPRFFVEKDEVVLSAVVHNHLEAAADVTVSMELAGAALAPIEASPRTVNLASGAETRVDWRVRALAEGTAKVKMQALSAAESDAVELPYPVLVHGMLKTDSWSASLAADQPSARLDLTVPTARRPEHSLLQIRWSPSIAASLVDALPYLIEYPYGCTEQTVNRFVPAVIVRKTLADAGIRLADIRTKAVNLNPQELGDARERAERWKRSVEDHPVFNEQRLDRLIDVGVRKLADLQNPDGGWGWFTDASSPHTTAVVTDALQRGLEAGGPVPADLIARAVDWLDGSQRRELARLALPADHAERKSAADAQDAFTALILSRANRVDATMLDALYRDRLGLGPYGLALLGQTLHASGRPQERDMVRRNLEQFLKTDPENQTAWLQLGDTIPWWSWYGDSFETHAAYLKLLVLAEPTSPTAPAVAKWILNNRRHGSSWHSTRDTALCLDAIAAYLKASGEIAPDLTVEVLLDGQVRKSVRITPDDLFSYESALDLGPADLGDGPHTLEFRKAGKGPLYVNAYLTNFTQEDPIAAAGLEVRVDRTYWKLVPKPGSTLLASGSRGQILDQPSEAFDRVRLGSGDVLASGDVIEVELILESKNTYDYLVVEDPKPAGCEPLDLRSGWYGGAYRELRDRHVALFYRQLPQGRTAITHRLRAEIPGTFSALPARIAAMYAPELRGNSDEWKVTIQD